MAYKYRKTVNANYHRKQAVVREYKEKLGCKDCKNTFPHYQLEFDHVKGKNANVARLVGCRASLEKIMLEISKCDVVCSNCHKKRTWDRLQEVRKNTE